MLMSFKTIQPFKRDDRNTGPKELLRTNLYWFSGRHPNTPDNIVGRLRFFVLNTIPTRKIVFTCFLSNVNRQYLSFKSLDYFVNLHFVFTQNVFRMGDQNLSMASETYHYCDKLYIIILEITQYWNYYSLQSTDGNIMNTKT